MQDNESVQIVPRFLVVVGAVVEVILSLNFLLPPCLVKPAMPVGSTDYLKKVTNGVDLGSSSFCRDRAQLCKGTLLIFLLKVFGTPSLSPTPSQKKCIDLPLCACVKNS